MHVFIVSGFHIDGGWVWFVGVFDSFEKAQKAKHEQEDRENAYEYSYKITDTVLR